VWHPGCINLSPNFGFQPPVYEARGNGVRYVRPYWKNLDENVASPPRAAITNLSSPGRAASISPSAPGFLDDVIYGCGDLNAHEVYRSGEFVRCDCNEGFAQDGAGHCIRPFRPNTGGAPPVPVPPTPGPGPAPPPSRPSREDRVNQCKAKAAADANGCSTRSYRNCVAQSLPVMREYCTDIAAATSSDLPFSFYWWACSQLDSPESCNLNRSMAKFASTLGQCVQDGVLGTGQFWSKIKSVSTKFSFPIGEGGGHADIGIEGTPGAAEPGLYAICFAATRQLAVPKCTEEQNAAEAKCDQIQ
jgi:hypothetical protein